MKTRRKREIKAYNNYCYSLKFSCVLNGISLFVIYSNLQQKVGLLPLNNEFGKISFFRIFNFKGTYFVDMHF